MSLADWEDNETRSPVTEAALLVQDEAWSPGDVWLSLCVHLTVLYSDLELRKGRYLHFMDHEINLPKPTHSQTRTGIFRKFLPFSL